MPHRAQENTPDWQRPAADESGLREYASTLREGIWLIVASVVVCLLVAGAYVAFAGKVYEARADLLVSPVPADDPLLASLGLIRQSSDPTRDVETAATLAQTIDVAELAAQRLEGGMSARSVLDDVMAEPIATSNIVAITAEADDPQEAADLANAMAQAVVEDRTAALNEQAAAQLEALETSADASDPTAATEADLARLESLANSPDPTVRVETEARAPEAPVSPNVRLTLAAALLIGLVLGGIGAFASQALDPRLRREEQLRARFSLPILARVPRENPRRGAPMAPGNMSQASSEAYRSLRANLAASVDTHGGPAQTILVTGSVPSEGKTSTAINLAASFALAGSSVILIEADLRRPAVATALGLETPRRGGIAAALLGNISLEDALVTSEPFGRDLKFLLADYRGSAMGELFSLRAAQRLIREAQRLADYVIIDSPPLAAVVDTLPLARAVDDVVVVCRLGVTRLDKLAELGELLAGNGVTPTGIALIGVPRTETGASYYYDSRSEDENRSFNSLRGARRG